MTQSALNNLVLCLTVQLAEYGNTLSTKMKTGQCVDTVQDNLLNASYLIDAICRVKGDCLTDHAYVITVDKGTPTTTEFTVTLTGGDTSTLATYNGEGENDEILAALAEGVNTNSAFTGYIATLNDDGDEMTLYHCDPDPKWHTPRVGWVDESGVGINSPTSTIVQTVQYEGTPVNGDSCLTQSEICKMRDKVIALTT